MSATRGERSAALMRAALTGVRGEETTDDAHPESLFAQSHAQMRERGQTRAALNAYELFTKGGQRGLVEEARRQVQSTMSFRELEMQVARGVATTGDEAHAATSVPSSVTMVVGNLPDGARRTLQRAVKVELASRVDRDASKSAPAGSVNIALVRDVIENGSDNPYLGDHTALRVGKYVIGGSEGRTMGDQTFMPARKGVRAVRARAVYAQGAGRVRASTRSGRVRAVAPKIEPARFVVAGPVSADEQPTMLAPHGRSSLMKSPSMRASTALRASLASTQPSAAAIMRETQRRSTDSPAALRSGSNGLQQGARDGRVPAAPAAMPRGDVSGTAAERELEFALGVTSKQLPEFVDSNRAMQSVLASISTSGVSGVSTVDLRLLGGYLEHITGVAESQLPDAPPSARAVADMKDLISTTVANQRAMMPPAADRARAPPRA